LVQPTSVSNRFSKLDEDEDYLTLEVEVDEITDAICDEYKENGVKKMSSKVKHATLTTSPGSKKKRKIQTQLEREKKQRALKLSTLITRMIS
jgi:uncharacterized protein YgbK (DUF1537 family)